MAETKLQWFCSCGGPLLLLPEQLLSDWTGIDPPADGREIKVTARWNPGAPATDYDRACEAGDLIANLDVGQGRGIVLGGEPHATAVWWNESDTFLVRWVEAETEAEILEQLPALVADLEESGIATIDAHPGPLVLFDAACPGEEIETDRIDIPIRPGQYLAHAAEARTDGDLSLIVIRLEKVD